LLAALVPFSLLVSCRQNGGPPQNYSIQNTLVQAPAGSNESFTLGRAELVPGTVVFRANLFLNDSGFISEKRGFETRNILFINALEKDAHWLLSDTNHVIQEATDIADDNDAHSNVAEDTKARSKKTLAILAYVKARREQWRDFPGQLLLSDGTGRHVAAIADQVTDVQVARLLGSEIIVIYERNSRLVVQAFDPTSLTKKREQEIEIPPLK
jgi:hypothetical protein